MTCGPTETEVKRRYHARMERQYTWSEWIMISMLFGFVVGFVVGWIMGGFAGFFAGDTAVRIYKLVVQAISW